MTNDDFATRAANEDPLLGRAIRSLKEDGIQPSVNSIIGRVAYLEAIGQCARSEVLSAKLALTRVVRGEDGQ